MPKFAVNLTTMFNEVPWSGLMPDGGCRAQSSMQGNFE